ncbi:MAG: helix-hairpin-helix domain-containing protein, partial [Balneolaceae bacterium]
MKATPLSCTFLTYPPLKYSPLTYSPLKCPPPTNPGGRIYAGGIRMAIAGLMVFLAVSAAGPGNTELHAQSSGPQPDPVARQVERDIERILDEADPEDSGEDPEELIRMVRELAANPLNVNRASAEELMSVPGMTWSLAGAITEHRETVKPFESADGLT